MMPVGFYAMIESALRYARGETVDANRHRIARRYQRFSEIAAQNPHAWKRDVLSIEQIRDPVGKIACWLFRIPGCITVTGMLTRHLH
ncbi:MAG: hypothetical protein IPK95_05180 [Cellvibrionales bacterium]|nr:hypothetical protein [Cellvibrionales bacterium]